MRRQQGFTLIEVLVAITLLVIGILAAASMQIGSLGGNDIAIRVTEASSWGGDTLETLMSRAYTHADLADDDGNGANGLNCTDNTGAPACIADGGPTAQGGFTVFWNVAEDYPITDCKTIRVVVRRSDRATVKTVAIDFIKMRPI